jgi:hypothetical protein
MHFAAEGVDNHLFAAVLFPSLQAVVQSPARPRISSGDVTMRFKLFSLAILILVAMLGMFVSGPSVALAAPSGTQSLSIVHRDQAVHFNLQGMSAKSDLTVTASTDPTSAGSRDRSQAFPTTDANGNADIVVFPFIVTDTGYTGPLYITICDASGACIFFTLTIRGELSSWPLPVGNAANNGYQQDCYYLQRIGQGDLKQPEVRAWLLRQEQQYVELLIANCGFSTSQQVLITNKIFDFLFDEL